MLDKGIGNDGKCAKEAEMIFRRFKRKNKVKLTPLAARQRFGMLFRGPGWYPRMLFAFMTSIFLAFPANSAEPETDCNQFATKEKNPGVNFKPEWLTPEMEQWDRNQQFSEGVKRSANQASLEELRKGAYWFCRSAMFGDSRGERRIAEIYRDGVLVDRDSVMAFRWMLRAAKDGDQKAQLAVSRMYASGEGTAADQREAQKWDEIEKNGQARNFEVFQKIDVLRNKAMNETSSPQK